MFEPTVPTTSIKDLESLTKDHVKGRIVKHEVRPLTEVGENFGSEIVVVDMTVEEDEKEHVVHAVAKLIPPTDMQQEIFNTKVTYKNEIGFYAEIVPALKLFQKEQGVANVAEVLDYFPELYGARISLNPSSNDIDKDAVILMENLKISGFKNLDRQNGFDLPTTKLVLKTFAKFQATVVGLKLKRPDIFEAKVKPYIYEWKSEPPFMTYDNVITENPETAHLAPRVARALEKGKLRIKRIREPWATIIHNDAWVNNIMLKLSNEEVVDIKLVDFQIFDYASPACDVIFFLLTSVQVPVLKYHFDKLLRFYYDEFISTLQLLRVDINPFTYESFQEELKIEGPYQVYHSLFLLPVVFGPKGGFRKPPGKVREWNPNGISNGSSSPATNGPPKPGAFKLTQQCKEKLWYIVEEAAKRKWI